MSKNITLSISDEVYEKMKEFTEIKWSEVARRAIEDRVEALNDLNEIAAKSKLSEKDVQEISKKIKKGIARRHGLTK